MHWYDPEEGKVEDVRAPSTDEEALEMLSGHPDSDGLVERYVVLREEGLGVEQALVFVGHRLRMQPPEAPEPRPSTRVPTHLLREARRAKEAHRYGQAHFGADGVS
jgi:hypothetical protein